MCVYSTPPLCVCVCFCLMSVPLEAEEGVIVLKASRPGCWVLNLSLYNNNMLALLTPDPSLQHNHPMTLLLFLTGLHLGLLCV